MRVFSYWSIMKPLVDIDPTSVVLVKQHTGADSLAAQTMASFRRSEFFSICMATSTTSMSY